MYYMFDIYIYIYIHIHIPSAAAAARPCPARRRWRPGGRSLFVCFDSASLPYKFLTRLPGVCSGGEGTPPETLNSLMRNPIS